MGKPERKARERLWSSSSYFLRCFGISRKIHLDKPMVETGQDKKNKKKKKTRSRWFSSRATRFRLKNGEITTTPIYETEKQNLTIEDDKQTLFQVIRQVTDRKYIAAFGQETKEKDTNELRDINPDPLSFSGYDTFPGSGRLDPVKSVGFGSKTKESREKKKSSRVRKVDPVIGIIIIMVTLMIMLKWGRLCAILCTSTWCYFLPRLKEAGKRKRKRSGGVKAKGVSFADDLDLNSDAYKKKVVLQGFLVRQHRVSL